MRNYMSPIVYHRPLVILHVLTKYPSFRWSAVARGAVIFGLQTGEVESRQARTETPQNVHSPQTDKLDELPDDQIWGNLTQLLAEFRERKKKQEAKISELREREKIQEAEISEFRKREKTQEAKISELRERERTQEAKILGLQEDYRKQQQHLDAMSALQSDFRGQIEKMTQIISQLHSRGLPQAPDDGHLQRSLDSIVHDIMQFAQAFTTGQDTLTWEILFTCTTKLSKDMQDYLQGKFLNLSSLVSSRDSNVGAKVRTRCVQVIMFRHLIPAPLLDRPLGFPKDFGDIIKENFRKNMRCSGK